MEGMVARKVVKQRFLLANAFKSIAKNHGKLGFSGLEDNYLRLKEELESLEEEFLDEKIEDKIRLQRYNAFEWYNGEVSLSDLGVWPKMNHLDIRLTTGSAVDSAKGIENPENQAFVPEELRKKLKSMREISGFIYPRFPIIVFEGGLIRGEYNTWAKENNKPLCSIFSYDSDDGSCRSITYSLERLEKVPAFIPRI